MVSAAGGKRGRPPKAAPGPTLERLRHGDVALMPHAIADESGNPSRPYRSADTLARMLRQGSVTPAMCQAADDFRAQFARASLDPLGAPDLRRPPQGAGHGLELSEQQVEARRRVWRALTAVGGIASPAGSCLWHVIGCELSLRQWALREGWGGGRAMSQETAAGVLVGALCVLQTLYGL
ncbi:MAG TPA: hypothetical protein VMU87_13845 [Stellaceae bacterium]|nr:hypothetical protein [Stellaceae bacterium]